MENTTTADTYFTRRLAKKGQPLIIAGPCSAESEEQVLTVARALKAAGATTLYLAGKAGDLAEPLKAAGVDGTLHAGGDVLALLTGALAHATNA